MKNVSSSMACITPGKTIAVARELLQRNTRAQLCSGRMWTTTTGLLAKQKVLGCSGFLERKKIASNFQIVKHHPREVFLYSVIKHPKP